MLVVSETQFLLQRLILDNHKVFLQWLIRPSWKTKNFRNRIPMLYQFCIANNAVETFLRTSLFKAMDNAVETNKNYNHRFSQLEYLSHHHLSSNFVILNNLLKHNSIFIYPCETFVEQYIKLKYNTHIHISTSKTALSRIRALAPNRKL